MSEGIIKINPVRQRKFIPMNSESFFWSIWCQLGRSECGYKHFDRLNPMQLKLAACDHLKKRCKENDPVFCDLIQQKIARKEITDLETFCNEQRQHGTS